MSTDTPLGAVPDMYEVDEVAAKVRRSPRSIKEDARLRRIAHVRIGKKYMFTEDQVLQLIQGAIVPAVQPVDRYAAVRERLARQDARNAVKTRRPPKTDAA